MIFSFLSFQNDKTSSVDFSFKESYVNCFMPSKEISDL